MASRIRNGRMRRATGRRREGPPVPARLRAALGAVAGVIT